MKLHLNVPWVSSLFMFYQPEKSSMVSGLPRKKFHGVLSKCKKCSSVFLGIFSVEYCNNFYVLFRVYFTKVTLEKAGKHRFNTPLKIFQGFSRKSLNFFTWEKLWFWVKTCQMLSWLSNFLVSFVYVKTSSQFRFWNYYTPANEVTERNWNFDHVDIQFTVVSCYYIVSFKFLDNIV